MRFFELFLFFLAVFSGLCLLGFIAYLLYTGCFRRNNNSPQKIKKVYKGGQIPNNIIEQLATVSNSIPKEIVDAISAGNNEVLDEVIAKMDRFHPSVREKLRSLFSALGVIDKFIGELNCEYDNMRIYAAESLGRIGALQAVEPLLETLADKKEDVSMSAARALGMIEDKELTERLIEQLAKPGRVLPARLAEVLVAHGRRSVPGLLKALINTGDLTAKGYFIEILGEIGDKEAVPVLIAAMDSAYPDIRSRAAMALGQIKDKEAVEALMAALNDETPDVRALAARSLGMIQDARAVMGLQRLLHDSEWQVRINAIEALGMIGKDSIKILERVLEEEDYPEKERVGKILKELKDAS